MTIPMAMELQRTFTQFNPTCRLMDLVYQIAGGEGDLFPDVPKADVVTPQKTMLETGELDISALLPALEKLGWKPPE